MTTKVRYCVGDAAYPVAALDSLAWGLTRWAGT